MASPFQVVPEQASTLAPEVDQLFWFFMAVCGTTCVVVFVLVAFFAFRQRRSRQGELPRAGGPTLQLELAWTIFPLVVVLVLFTWGARLFARMYTAPDGALEIFVSARQWMWKVQHPSGVREINTLHVPVGVPVKLTMSSEDVVHSFFVPAFRVKRDVLPGRFVDLWFEATKPGRYHLFCAEYCGTDHSRMIGQVIVMRAADYQAWLGAGSTLTAATPGGALFGRLGCDGCHNGAPGARGPDLLGLFGTTRKLSDGANVRVDEAYLRDALLEPTKHVPWGWRTPMPTYAGMLDEASVGELVAYMKTLSAEAAR
jgi:cytochrome c oxidase subunit II